MGFCISYMGGEGYEEGVILIKVQTVFRLTPSPLSCSKVDRSSQMTSVSHGQEGEDRAGLVDRGKRVSIDAEMCSEVTEVRTVIKLRVRMRSSCLPARWVAGVFSSVRSKEVRRDLKSVACVLSRWMLKSPRSISCVPSSGRTPRSMSSSSTKSASGPGGR